MLQFIYGFLYSECSWLFLCNKLWYIIHLCEEFMLKMRRRKKKATLIINQMGMWYYIYVYTYYMILFDLKIIIKKKNLIRF